MSMSQSGPARGYKFSENKPEQVALAYYEYTKLDESMIWKFLLLELWH